MTQRINYFSQAPELSKKLFELSAAAGKCSLGPTLIDLINIRASQINGCTFCVDMHVKEAKIHGERELRIYHIPVWRESPLFSDKERAILEWTELLTSLSSKGISKEEFNQARAHLSETELSEVSIQIGVINIWNRLNAGLGAEVGSLDKMYGLDKANLK